jgi:hypothetical protein
METVPDEAAPGLRRLLATLKTDTDDPSADDTIRDRTDPDELVGTLLSVLWPEHLEIADALLHVPLR